MHLLDFEFATPSADLSSSFDVNHLLQLLASTRVSIWELDTVSQKQRAYGRLFHGIEAQHPTRQPNLRWFFEQFIHPEHRDKILTKLDYCLGQSRWTNGSVQVRIGQPNVGYRWHEIQCECIVDGTTLRSLNFRFDDIHDQKTVLDRLEFSNFLFSEASRLTHVGGWELSMRDNTLYWSDEVRRIHKVPEGFTPSLDQGILFYHPDDREVVRKTVADALENGTPFEFEARLLSMDGEELWVKSIGEAVRDENGIIVGVRGVFQDIQDYKLREEETKRLNDKLEENNQRLLNFAYIVSHNLRTHTNNLSAVLGFIHPEELSGETKSNVEMLHRISQNLSETIADLVNISDVQTIDHLQLKTLSLKAEVMRQLDALRANDEPYLNDCTVAIPDELTVRAQPGYLQSIVQNLITNAIKYRSEARLLEVHISAVRSGEFVELHVADNGIGINLEKHGDQLFGLYKRFTNRPDSRGVGLFLVKSQAEAMGGYVRAESRLGAGTTFIVGLAAAGNV